MTDLQVWCGTYLTDTVFSVQIDRNATVKALARIIHKRMKYEERRGLSASDVQLRLTRKENGERLVQNGTLKRLVQGEIDTTVYPIMDPQKTLDSEDYFGSQPLPTRVMHVLVVLPSQDQSKSIRVWCGTYRTDTVFSIQIDRNATVEALARIIHKRMKYEERRGLSASDVQLRLARKENGEWLSREDALKGILQGKIDMTLYPPMLPLRVLDDFDYFGVQSLPVDKLHVLVVLPLEEIDGDVSLQDEPRKRKYDHSQVDACAGQEILACLNIHVEEVSSTPTSRSNNVCAADGFEWNSISVDCKEDESAPNKARLCDLYQAYLARHLDDVLKTEKLCVIGVPEDLKVLTVGVRDIQFTGQPDLLILSDHARNDPSSLQLLPNVQMLVEVRQRVDPDDDFMAMTELIALDLVARTPVVALLTDLNSNWRFFWVAEATDDHAVVHKTTITTPSEAFDVLREFLSHSISEVENGSDGVAMDRLVKRRKMSHLQRPGGGGLRELVRRFRNVRDELGPDGAAELAYELANHMVQSIPAYHFHSW